MQMAAAEAERIFLGQILATPEKLMECKVSADHFALEAHRQVFETVREMEIRNEAIDPLAVGAAMESNADRNWLVFLSQMVADSLSAPFFDTAQKVIIEEHKKREVRQIAASLLEDFDSDQAIQSLMGLEVVEQKFSHTMTEAAMAAIKKAEITAQGDGITGLPTGLAKLDDTIGGFQSPDLYVLGARPAMGKTAVALNFMLNHNAPVLFFSTEQPAEQIGLRAISAQSSVSAKQIRVADFSAGEYERMSYAVSQLMAKHIHIYDRSHLTLPTLMREARRMKYNHGIKAVYVDYIQRIKANAENRRLEVAEVVTGLKSLARELQVPVIALAQVSRAVEKRDDRRPRMGDLLESGVIEQEADVVALLYRDEVYHENSTDKGVIEILIDKNRHGVTGQLKFAWLAETMQIKDITPQSIPFGVAS